jgi:hypothetical protein
MDLTKDRAKLKELYMPGTADFTRVDVPELPFAMIDGRGAPESDAIGHMIKGLFIAIQPIRREARARLGKDFVEAPVEILYWADDMDDLVHGNREKWHWRVMITLPAWTDAALFHNATAELRKQDSAPDSLRMERFTEGTCVQVMQVGQMEQISARLSRLYQQFLPENGLAPAGAYHEIYLGDWNRTAPERRRIILRQPVRPMA